MAAEEDSVEAAVDRLSSTTEAEEEDSAEAVAEP